MTDATCTDAGDRPLRDAAARAKSDYGGHFAATDAPDLLLEDIRGFFRGLR